MKFTRSRVVAGVVGGGLVIALFSGFSQYSSGERRQNGLNAEYNKTVIALGDCLDQSRQAARVSQELTKAQRDILEAAVAGRYKTEDGASTASRDAASQQRAFVSAVVEAYPNLDKVSEIFQNVLTIVTGCRAEYNGAQKKLQVHIATFEDWKDTINPFTIVVKKFYPTKGLEAKAPGYDSELLTGDAALRRMKEVIVVKEAGKAYRDGELESQDPYQQEQPAPTP